MCESSNIRYNWKSVINGCREYLKKNISDDVLQDILDHVLSVEAITHEERERVLSEHTRCDKIGCLIDQLQLKREEDCFQFANWFQRHSQLKHIWEYLKNESFKEKYNKRQFQNACLGDEEDDHIHLGVDLQEYFALQDDRTVTIRQIRSERFQEQLRFKYGKQWKIVLRKLEDEKHPLREWAAEICGILKKDASDQQQSLIDAIHTEICSIHAHGNKEEQSFKDIEDASSVQKQDVMDILFEFCHKVVEKAGDKADKCDTPNDTVFATYILFECVEIFRVLFLQAHSKFTPTSNAFPVVHKHAYLRVDRIGTEWFLDLTFKIYLNIKKHKNLRNLNIINQNNRESSKDEYMAVYDPPKYWPCFDKSFFTDVEKFNEDTQLYNNINHVLSREKVFEKVESVFKINPCSNGPSHGISESFTPKFHFSQHVTYLPVLSRRLEKSYDSLSENAKWDYWFLNGEVTIGTQNYEIEDLYFEESDLDRRHRAAVQTLHHLLSVQDVKISQERLRTISLWILEKGVLELRSLNTFDSVSAFTNAIYSDFVEAANDHKLYSNPKCCYSMSYRNHPNLKKRINELGNKFDPEKLTKKGNILTPSSVGDFTKQMLENEIYNFNDEKLFVAIFLMLADRLIWSCNTGVTFWEVLPQLFFNIHFGILSYLLISIAMYTILTNKIVSSMIVIAIFAAYDSGGMQILHYLEQLHGSFNYFYRNSILFSTTYIFSLEVLLIFAFTMYYINGIPRNINKIYGDSIRNKVYMYVSVQNQEICRANWLYLSPSSFDSEIIPRLLTALCTMINYVSTLIGMLAVSPLCFGIYMRTSFHKLSPNLQIIPSFIPLGSVLLYHIIFQRNNNIYWSVFILHYLVINTALYIFRNSFSINLGYTLPYRIHRSVTKTWDAHRIIKRIILIKHYTFWLALLFSCSVPFREYFDGYNIFAGGLPFVDFYALAIVYIVSHKLFRIHSGKLTFPKERTRIFYETVKYHEMPADHETNYTSSISLEKLWRLICDVFRLRLWELVFIQNFQ